LKINFGKEVSDENGEKEGFHPVGEDYFGLDGYNGCGHWLRLFGFMCYKMRYFVIHQPRRAKEPVLFHDLFHPKEWRVEDLI
jgi:hypothetical protein